MMQGYKYTCLIPISRTKQYNTTTIYIHIHIQYNTILIQLMALANKIIYGGMFVVVTVLLYMCRIV